MKKIIPLVAVAFAIVGSIPFVSARARGEEARPAPLSVTFQVEDLTTGKAISSGETVAATDQFQVTVKTNNINCAGQYVVTALGATGAPPSVLVQTLPYIIGPFGGSNSATGEPLTANGPNDWKISTTCNGSVPGQFASRSFEFFAQ